jgi:hypothetical protein
LNYFGEDAIYGHEGTELKTSRPIASLTCYAYNDWGSLQAVQDVYDEEEDNLVSAAWVSTTMFGENNDTFRVKCEDLSLIPDSAKNTKNGEGEAVVLVEYTDGTYSAVYFHIGAGAPGADSGVAFVSDYAGMAGASLVKLQEGDELYDANFSEYSSTAMPADFYHLTYDYPIGQNMYSMVELSGLNGYFATPLSDWAFYSSEVNAVIMEPAGAGELPGVILFKDSNSINKVVILCTLNSAE